MNWNNQNHRRNHMTLIQKLIWCDLYFHYYFSVMPFHILFFIILSQIFTIAFSLVRLTTQHSNISQSCLMKEKKGEGKREIFFKILFNKRRGGKREFCFARHIFSPQNKMWEFSWLCASEGLMLSFFGSCLQVLSRHCLQLTYICMHVYAHPKPAPGQATLVPRFSPRLLTDHFYRGQHSQSLLCQSLLSNDIYLLFLLSLK